MFKMNCPALDEITEIKKVNVGNTSNGPIIVDKEEIDDRYCSFKKTNFFNCENCHFFKSNDETI